MAQEGRRRDRKAIGWTPSGDDTLVQERSTNQSKISGWPGEAVFSEDVSGVRIIDKEDGERGEDPSQGARERQGAENKDPARGEVRMKWC